MFSVVITSYNKEKYIARTVHSVLAQTYSNFELIVVDDGSIDSSVSVLSNIVDHRLNLIFQNNSGPGPARNTGIKASSGDWIAFLDGDDFWAPSHLTELSNISHKFPETRLVATKSVECPSNDFPALQLQYPHIRKIDYFKEASRRPSIIHSSSVAIHRSTFHAIGYFSDFPQGEDTEFWARCCLVFPCAVSNLPSSFYCRGTGGIMEQKWLANHSSRKHFVTTADLGPSVDYLLTILEKDTVRRVLRNSIIQYINSRVTILLKTNLFSGNTVPLPQVASMYLSPISPYHRFWKFFATLPSPILTLSYTIRALLRVLYRNSYLPK